MNAYATLVVTEHLETLRREAAERHAAAAGPPSIRARIAARLAGLRATYARSEVPADPLVPRLDGHPYRG